jgi:hypothetical protein
MTAMRLPTEIVFYAGFVICVAMLIWETGKWVTGR